MKYTIGNVYYIDRDFCRIVRLWGMGSISVDVIGVKGLGYVSPYYKLPKTDLLKDVTYNFIFNILFGET